MAILLPRLLLPVYIWVQKVSISEAKVINKEPVGHCMTDGEEGGVPQWLEHPKTLGSIPWQGRVSDVQVFFSVRPSQLLCRLLCAS